MKYILLIYGEESAWESASREEMERVYEAHQKYGEALGERLQGGAELKPSSTATTIRFDGGKTRTTDGPFAEAKEQLGGYYLIEAENLEEAIDWAEKIPMLQGGAVEIRPLGLGA